MVEVLLLGDSGVGKSTLSYAFVYRDGFPVCDMPMYIYRARLQSTKLTIQNPTGNSEIVNIGIWDLFKVTQPEEIHDEMYRATDVLLLIYDWNRQETMSHLDDWLRISLDKMKNIRQKKKVKQRKRLPAVLAVTKIDLCEDQKELSTITERGEKLALELSQRYYNNEYTIPFNASSSKSGINIEKLFEIVIEKKLF